LKFSSLHKSLKHFVLLLLFSIIASPLYAQDSIPYKDIAPYFNEARKLRNQNKIDQALETLDKASEEAEKNEDIKALIDSYHELSLLYLKLEKEADTQFYWDRGHFALS